MTTLYTINKPRHRSKVAIIDYDWTICKPKNNKTFPTDVDDWEWLRPSVPDVIKDLYHKKGFAICIATNQSKEWKHTQIINALTTLNIPLKIAVATTKASYKPSLQIYEELFTKPIDKTKSFMCGDALGRPNDHSDCDLKFAEAIGIKILSPEELFPFDKKDTTIVIKPSETQEIVIMVGMPGSGKSHLAKTFTKPFSKPFTKTNYVIIEGDIYKTSEKMIKAAIPHLDKGTSVVFDATNPTREKRKEYITVAERYKIPVRCIYMNTSMEEAIARNNLREKPVPRIVYNVYNKKFQVPDSTYENCSVIIL